ncbi:MAG: transposase [Patescibacteria group bacterium]
MIVLGFDVAKDYLDAALINRSRKTQATYHLANTRETIEELLTATQAKHPKLVVGCESTGYYQQLLLRLCLKR